MIERERGKLFSRSGRESNSESQLRHRVSARNHACSAEVRQERHGFRKENVLRRDHDVNSAALVVFDESREPLCLVRLVARWLLKSRRQGFEGTRLAPQGRSEA